MTTASSRSVSLPPGLAIILQGALRVGGLATACLLVAVFARWGASLLFLSLAAAAAFAGGHELERRVAPQGPGPLWRSLATDLLRALILFAGAWGFLAVWSPRAPSGVAYFDTVLVPFRPAVALGGAFVVSLLTQLLRAMRPQAPAWPLVQGALFWVSPFYGFFSAAVFTAMVVIGLGPMRGDPRAFGVAAGMLVLEGAGRAAALWFLRTPQRPPA